MLAPAEALALARRAVERSPIASRGKFVADDFDDATFVLSRDLHHLDADAMSDRLNAWIAREVSLRLPSASAIVSYHQATPESEESDPDEEALWRGVEPTLKLDLHARPLAAADVEAWAALLPAFLRVVDGAGRPEGWRPDPSVGGVE